MDASREPAISQGFAAVRSGTHESVRGLKVICDESFEEPLEKLALSEGGHIEYPNDKAGEERQRSEKTLSGAEDEERVDGVSAMSFFLPYRPAHRDVSLFQTNRQWGHKQVEVAVDASEGQMVKLDTCWHLVREQRSSVSCRSVCQMERDGALRTDTHKHLDNGIAVADVASNTVVAKRQRRGKYKCHTAARSQA